MTMNPRSLRAPAALSFFLLAASAAGCANETSDDASSPALTAAATPPGTSLSAPDDLRAFPGGDSVALRWAPSASGVASFRVYRDGAVYASNLAPASGGASNIYLDVNVKVGVGHRYEIAAVTSTGAESPKSASVTAGLPTDGYSLGKITIEGQPSEGLLRILQDGQRALQIWFPKMVNYLSVPSKYPSRDLVIVVSPDCYADGWAFPGTPRVFICSTPGNPTAALIVHEAIHTFQLYGDDAPSLMYEGIATWSSDMAMGVNRPTPQSPFTYMNGYEYGAAFLDWIVRNGSPNAVSELSKRAVQSTFGYQWFPSVANGKNVNVLWNAMNGMRLTLPGRLATAIDLCANFRDSAVELETCQERESNTFAYEAFAKRLHLGALCMSVVDDRVVYAACDETPAGRWQYTGHGWKNELSGNCLQPEGGVLSPGTPLVTATCDDSLAQMWTDLSF